MTVFKKKLLAAGVATAALALLLTLPAAPASADCGSLTQGTYESASDTFTPGTAATDIDYMVDCADDDGDSLTEFGVDNIPANLTTDSYVVVNVGGTDPFAEYDAASLRYVLKVSGIDTAQTGTEGVIVYTPDGNSLWVEVHGNVTTRGDGSIGVNVWLEGGSGSATAINRGTINTHGDVNTSGTFDEDSHGLLAGSVQGTATATNYGRIETRGNKADGINAYAGTDGTATARNYGTVITRGSAHLQVFQVGTDPSSVGRPTTPAAVQAYSEGGDAHAVNMAGGMVEAHGNGSTGVHASVGGYIQSGGTGDALAENSGTVTTAGDMYQLDDPNNANHGAIRSPTGVGAYTQGAGEARAINHESGMIETTGTNGIGLFAWSASSGATGNTTAINRGTIVTRGDLVAALNYSDGVSAPGIQSESAAGDATAENDGNVDTYGTGAHGVLVISRTANATAVNRGNITTYHTASDPANAFAERAFGLVAVARSGNAEATNEAGGQVTTKGEWGFGILAETHNDGSSPDYSRRGCF